jgi:HEAT repeat protein
MNILRRLFGRSAKPDRPPTFESLMADLKRARFDWERSEVAERLGGLGDPRAIEPLKSLLRTIEGPFDHRPSHALERLGVPAIEVATIRRPEIAGQLAEVERLEGQRDLDGLAAFLKIHISEHVIARAAKALGKTHDARAIPPLLELLNASGWISWHAAAEALVEIGEPALQALLKGIEQHTIKADPAAFALGEIRDRRVLQPLLSILRSARDKSEAAKALAKIGDPSAVQPLLAELPRQPDYAKDAIVEALEALHWAPTTDEERALLLIGQDRFQDAAALGMAAARPLMAALREAIAGKDWPPCEGPAKALCRVMGDPLRSAEEELANDDYNRRWAVLSRIIATVEGHGAVAQTSKPVKDTSTTDAGHSLPVETRDQDMAAAVGQAIDITKRDWGGLRWDKDPATAASADFRVVLPGTYVLSKIEDGWVYIRQGYLQYKLELGDVRVRWPHL